MLQHTHLPRIAHSIRIKPEALDDRLKSVTTDVCYLPHILLGDGYPHSNQWLLNGCTVLCAESPRSLLVDPLR